MIKMTIEFDGDITDFENALDMDDQFCFTDSIIYQLDYGSPEHNVVYHNNIKITIDKESYEN